MTEKKLTIGMCTYDDFHGVYFSVQALRMYHNIVNTNDTEIIVVDNNPSSKHGKETKRFVESKINCRYIPMTHINSTSIKNEIFCHAEGRITICMDCHVLLVKGAIDSVLHYYSDPNNQKDLVSGPLLYDDLKSMSTHFKPVFNNHMYGVWGTDQKIHENKPFEIPMQGTGCFACVTEHWPSFNSRFVGFGAEEGYIHEKIRLRGGKCMCLPDFKWVHRFGRPDGVKYPLKLEDRVWNYFVGWLELYQDPGHQMIKDIYNHFKDTLPKGKIDSIFSEALKTIG